MRKEDRKNMILEGSIYKLLLSLSFPIMINSIIQTLYNLVDGVYVSKISSVHFAATSFVWPINFLFISIGLGLSVAGTSILSQLIGKDKIEKGKEYAGQLIAITLILSIIFTVIGYFISPYLIYLMGARGDFRHYSEIYLKITFLDLPFMFMFFNINSIMNAQGDTITPTILSGISAIVNIILDPIFIFDLGMGIAGAAWATLVSRALLAVLGLYFLFRDNNIIKPSFKGFRLKRNIIDEIISVAVPASLGQSGSAMGFMVLNFFISSYGTATMAAFGMVNRITALIMQPAMAIGSALTAVVGQNIGADRLDRVIEAFRKALFISITMGILGAGLLIFFDSQIIDVFMKSKDDPAVIRESLSYLHYISLSMPFMGIFSVFQGIYQGTGHTKYSMAMEVGRLWVVRLPMILIFKKFSNWGSTAIWFSMSFSNAMICLFGYIIYRKGKWKKKVLREH